MVTPIQEDQQPRRKERQRKTYPHLPVEGQFLLPKGFDPFAETKQPGQEPIPMGFNPDNFPQAQADVQTLGGWLIAGVVAAASVGAKTAIAAKEVSASSVV